MNDSTEGVQSAPLDVWSESFPSVAATIQLELRLISPQDAELSEAEAAAFLLRLVRDEVWFRDRFPGALIQNENGTLYRWLSAGGATKLGLSPLALKKLKGVMRRPPGRRVYDIYLNDPELQRTFALGLLPAGQWHFLGWLTTYGRKDHQLSNEQILWFLYQSARDVIRGVSLTYLLQPSWQERFPLALTRRGWRPFLRWVTQACGQSFPGLASWRFPRILPPTHQQALKKVSPGQRVKSLSGSLTGVNILSHFCNPSGIQQAALWTKAALDRVGLCTSCRDVPVPRRFVPTDRANWLGLEIFPITIMTHAATPYFADAYVRSGLWRRNGVYRIAYWAWELERVPDEWLEVAPLIEEIWSPTEFVANAMRSRMPVPVYEMLPGVEIGRVETITRASLGIPEGNYVFLFMFDLHSQIHRKNPGGVIAAFDEAFRRDDKVTLVIKASGGDIFTKDFETLKIMCRARNVLLVHESMPRERAYGLIQMCDCFVSLHRSEGFGLGLAEAMLLKKPVVATGYSGNLAFMDSQNSLLVNYKMVEIVENRPVYTKGNWWAEPSTEEAAAYMRQVYENREAAAEKATQVQPQIRQLLSLEAAGHRMKTRLRSIAASRGFNSARL